MSNDKGKVLCSISTTKWRALETEINRSIAMIVDQQIYVCLFISGRVSGIDQIASFAILLLSRKSGLIICIAISWTFIDNMLYVVHAKACVACTGLVD